MKSMLPIVAGMILSAGAAADDRTMADFALEQIHKVKMRACDQAVRSIFGTANGEDIRVFTDVLPGDEGKAVRVTAVWGNQNDTVMVDADLRREGSRCSLNVTTTIYLQKSCAMYLAENPVWKVKSETVGVLAAFNAGNVRALLSPVGGSCAIAYFQGNVFEAQVPVARQ